MGAESHQGQSVSVAEVTVNIFLSLVSSTQVLLPRALPSQVNVPALALISLMAIFKRHREHLKTFF